MNQFGELADRADILFSFVAHDEKAIDEERRTTEKHLNDDDELVDPA